MEMEYKELTEEIKELKRMMILNRDLPPTETWSKLFKDLNNRIDVLEKKIDPILEALNTAGNVKKAIIWFSALVLGITGTGFGLKTIFTWLK